MFAALLKLPSWLLILVAVGVLGGQFAQLECKLRGCDAATVASSESGEHHDGDSSSPGSEHHCPCQCHFVTLAWFEIAPIRAVLQSAREVDLAEAFARAPDSPCVDIEHPPQLA